MECSAPSSHGGAFTLGRGTLVSRLLGFARDAAIAALVGAGWTADALLLAFRIPNMARTFLAEGAAAYTLVPAYHAAREGGDGHAWTFVRSAMYALVLILGAAALLGGVFSGQLARLLAPGLRDMPDVLALTAGFLSLCVMPLPLMAGAAVCAAALMAEGRFREPAYASAVSNLTVIVFAGAAFCLYGAGDARVPYLLCAGAIAAGAVLWAYQAVPLAALGFSWFGPVAFGDAVFRRALRALPGSVFGVGGHYLNLFAAAVLASFLAEGGISALYYAERLIGLPLGVIGASTGLAALTDLSRFVYARNQGAGLGDELGAFASRLAGAVRGALFFALPAAVGTACLAMPLTSVAFGYGEFDRAALAATSSALLALTVGLPALACVRPLLAGLGALGDGGAARRGALCGLAVTAIFGTALLVVDAPWGVALAVSLAAWVNAAVLFRALGRCGVFPCPGTAWLLKVLLACVFMAVCVLCAAGFFETHPAKAATAFPGVAAYFAAAFLLRLDEAALLCKLRRK